MAHTPAAVPAQKTYFNDLADLFRIFADDTDVIYRGWVEQTVSDRSDRPDSRAVDLGCGSGRFAELLADRYAHVLAVDIADAQLEMARAEHPRPNLHFEFRSLLDVAPERDGRFDLVFSVNTVHHLRAHDVALPHLRSLVAPGGQVVVVDIIDPGQWRSRDWHIHEAFVDAEESYRHRSRDAGVAVDVLRLRLHPVWLEHMATSIPLPEEEFRRQYGECFPGAELTRLNKVVMAMHWRHAGG